MATPLDPEITDRILVLATPSRAVDLLRLATLRSDDVLFVHPVIAPEARRFADRFAIESASREATQADVRGADAILAALDDVEAENRLVRHARRLGVPVHVVGRPLVSDFSLLAMLERPGRSLMAA